jgi:hypothetical protein
MFDWPARMNSLHCGAGGGAGVSLGRGGGDDAVAAGGAEVVADAKGVGGRAAAVSTGIGVRVVVEDAVGRGIASVAGGRIIVGAVARGLDVGPQPASRLAASRLIHSSRTSLEHSFPFSAMPTRNRTGSRGIGIPLKDCRSLSATSALYLLFTERLNLARILQFNQVHQ